MKVIVVFTLCVDYTMQPADYFQPRVLNAAYRLCLLPTNSLYVLPGVLLKRAVPLVNRGEFGDVGSQSNLAL